MGLFDVDLLDADLLFQKLFRDATAPEVTVIGDLDTGSYAEIPILTHYSSIAQHPSGNGLWIVTLTGTVIAETSNAFDIARDMYKTVWAWHSPLEGIVQGVGAVESVEDISAPSRVGGEAQMEAKSVVQYTGSWSITARNH